MADTNYNGWTNYETWLVNAWYNDGDFLTDIVRENIDDVSDAANALQEAVTEHATEEMPSSGIASDFVNASLREVNWHELAETIAGDIQAGSKNDEK